MNTHDRPPVTPLHARPPGTKPGDATANVHGVFHVTIWQTLASVNAGCLPRCLAQSVFMCFHYCIMMTVWANKWRWRWWIRRLLCLLRLLLLLCCWFAPPDASTSLSTLSWLHHIGSPIDNINSIRSSSIHAPRVGPMSLNERVIPVLTLLSRRRP